MPFQRWCKAVGPHLFSEIIQPEDPKRIRALLRNTQLVSGNAERGRSGAVGRFHFQPVFFVGFITFPAEGKNVVSVTIAVIPCYPADSAGQVLSANCLEAAPLILVDEQFTRFSKFPVPRILSRPDVRTYEQWAQCPRVYPAPASRVEAALRRRLYSHRK